MEAARSATQFAPAERDSAEEVQRQAAGVSATSMLRQLLDAVPEMLVVLNDKRQIVFVNQTLLDRLGRKDPKSICGARPGDVLNCVHASETDGGCGTTESCRNCGAVLAVLASQQGKVGAGECRIAGKHPGEPHSLRVRATPLEIGGKQYTLFAAVDISAEKRRQTLERVLFGDVMEVSRQVRDSAGQLRVATSRMLEDLSTSLVQSSDRLAEGVNEHRILLAAERGDLRVQPVALNTAEVMRLLVGTFEALPIAAGRLMALAKPIHSAPFTSDRTLLKLVLGHMVRNALEACDPEQTVTLNAAVAQETVEFTVHNPGFMPRDVQLQVFQRGFTTKGEGRGLGTYTMRLLGERCLRGSVTFASTPNVGTTFKFNGPVSLAG